MKEMMMRTGNPVVLGLIQFSIGLIVATILYYIPSFKPKSESKHHSTLTDYLLIFYSTILGIILPLGIYGVIPIIGVLYRNQFQTMAIISFLISNSIFNLLIPFTDPTFTWSTGIPRIVLALIAGVLSGILLKIFPQYGEILFRSNFLEKLFGKRKPVSVSGMIIRYLQGLLIMVIILFLGQLANLLFQQYGLPSMMRLMYLPQFSLIARTFMMISIKPFFLLALLVMSTVIDLSKLSLFALIFKARGFGLVTGFYLILIILLILGSLF